MNSAITDLVEGLEEDFANELKDSESHLIKKLKRERVSDEVLDAQEDMSAKTQQIVQHYKNKCGRLEEHLNKKEEEINALEQKVRELEHEQEIPTHHKRRRLR